MKTAGLQTGRDEEVKDLVATSRPIGGILDPRLVEPARPCGFVSKARGSRYDGNTACTSHLRSEPSQLGIIVHWRRLEFQRTVDGKSRAVSLDCGGHDA